VVGRSVLGMVDVFSAECRSVDVEFVLGEIPPPAGENAGGRDDAAVVEPDTLAAVGG